MIPALCVDAVYADLIASGVKTIEIKSSRVPPPREGAEFVIVATSKGLSRGVAIERFGYTVETWRALPRSAVVALVRLAFARPARKVDALEACCQPERGARAWVLTLVSPLDPVAVPPDVRRGNDQGYVFRIPRSLVLPAAPRPRDRRAWLGWLAEHGGDENVRDGARLALWAAG